MKIKNKGQVPILEFISVAVILLISFSIFFPGFSYQNRWNDAVLFLKGRDMVLTLARAGLLYDYSFNPDLLQNFVNNIITDKNLVSWSEVQGTFKNKIFIACNCTVDQTGQIIDWIGRLKINGRNMDVDAVQSNLDNIQDSDVLVIWGREDLEPYKNNLLNYLSAGNGIVEVLDFKKKDFDSVQKEIFGVDECKKVTEKCKKNNNGPQIIAPTKANQITYDSYKLFYHLPLPLKATEIALVVPTQGNLIACVTTSNTGIFKFRNNNNRFWICGSSVYFDTNGNNNADVILSVGDSFSIDSSTFVLSYVDPAKIYISFRPQYVFSKLSDSDIIPYPIDQNLDRVFVASSDNREESFWPFAIINKSVGKAIWVTDFTLQPVEDDEKFLLASLILSAANRQTKELTLGNVRLGFLTSYINTVNKDIFEVYQFNLGLGFPF